MDILNTQKKEALKRKILKGINSVPQKDLKLSVAVRNLSCEFVVDPVTKARLKERILTRIESTSMRSAFWQKFLLFNKKFVSAFVLFVMAFSFVSIVTVNVHVVRAASFTTLQDFVGDVSIRRGMDSLQIESGMKLLENDVIETGGNGWVSIEYFDNSVTRLASNTKIVLEELDVADDVSSGVQVAVKEGQMWSKVVNLVDDSYFLVKANQLTAQAKKAAFNVDVHPDEVQLEVFSHAVKLGDGTELLSGRKIAVKDGLQQVEDISVGDKEIGWVKNNMKSDQEYVAKIEEKIESDKRVASKEGNFDNTLREDALLLITFDDVKKKKIELDLLEKKMIAAELTLNSGTSDAKQIEKAEGVVNDFSKGVKDFYGMVDEIELRDSDYAAELKTFVDEKVGRRQKDLSLVDPNEPLYEVKKVVDDLALVDVKDDIERIELEYQKAKEKLLDSEEKLASGDKDKASELRTEYEQKLADVTTKVGSLSEEQKALLTDNLKSDLLVKADVEEDKEGEEIKVGENTGTYSSVSATPTTSEGSYGVKVLDDKPLPPEL